MFRFFYAMIFETETGVILPDIDLMATAKNTMPQNCSINKIFSSLTKFYDTSSTDALIVVQSWSSSS
jgi:hypothetical protein